MNNLNNKLNMVTEPVTPGEEDTEDLFSMYVSTEPAAKLPFTGPSVSVGRTSTFATTTCSQLV